MGLRLILFFLITLIICLKSFQGRVIYLVNFLVFLYFTYPEKYVWGLEEYRIIFILNIVAIVCLLFEDINPFNKDKYSLLLLGLLGSFWISALLGPDGSSRPVDYAVLFSKVMLFWFILRASLKGDVEIDQFFNICVWSVGFLALWGIQQYFLGNTRLENFGGGQIAGSNQLASAFVWVLPIAGYNFLRQTGKERIISALFLVLLLFAIVCTESRQAFIAVLVMGTVFWFQSKSKVKILFCALLLFLCAIPFMPSTYFERMETISEYESDASAMGRVEQWKAAVKLSGDYPLLGVGGDNFTLFIPQYSDHPRESHNTYIQILAEEGILGLTIFLLIIFYTIKDLSKILKKYEAKKNSFYYQAAIARMSLIGVLVCCVFQNKAEHEFLYWSTAVTAALLFIEEKAQTSS